MIQTPAALARKLASGFTVARGASIAGHGPDLWSIVETGETVRATAVQAAIEAGELAVVTTDLFGQPQQLGRTPPPPQFHERLAA